MEINLLKGPPTRNDSLCLAHYHATHRLLPVHHPKYGAIGRESFTIQVKKRNTRIKAYMNNALSMLVQVLCIEFVLSLCKLALALGIRAEPYRKRPSQNDTGANVNPTLDSYAQLQTFTL